jgi:peptidoglycan/LPS O-acetylase OafA/YrhL
LLHPIAIYTTSHLLEVWKGHHLLSFYYREPLFANALLYVGVFTFSIALSALSYHVFEQRFLAMKSRFSAKPTRAPADVTPFLSPRRWSLPTGA